MSERKFREGESFADIGELIFWLDIGGWVYWRGRPKHPSIMESQPLRTLRHLIKPGVGQVVKAVPIQWGHEADRRPPGA